MYFLVQSLEVLNEVFVLLFGEVFLRLHILKSLSDGRNKAGNLLFELRVLRVIRVVRHYFLSNELVVKLNLLESFLLLI